MFAVKTQITKCIDDTGYPSFVECQFIDAHGVTRIFHEKDAILCDELLDRSSRYPVDGRIACEIIERKTIDGREIIKIDTEFPCYVESTSGEFSFDVLPEQITEFVWENSLLKINDFARVIKLHLQGIYKAFNKRAVEFVLAAMTEDVKWANGMEGGFVDGRDAVREYWRRQFAMINPQLEMKDLENVENKRAVVTVHQIVKDMDGNLLADKIVKQIFTFEDGLIKTFEIGDSD